MSSSVANTQINMSRDETRPAQSKPHRSRCSSLSSFKRQWDSFEDREDRCFWKMSDGKNTNNHQTKQKWLFDASIDRRWTVTKVLHMLIFLSFNLNNTDCSTFTCNSSFYTVIFAIVLSWDMIIAVGWALVHTVPTKSSRQLPCDHRSPCVGSLTASFCSTDAVFPIT